MIALTLLLTLTPPEAAAAAETPATAASEVPLARALFERGLLAYEAGDYAAATTHWSSAYQLMASDPALVKARRVLAFDLGQAHKRAYDVDGERSRLSQARPLLEDYVAWVDRPAHTMSDDEREDRARATEMLARIDILEGAPPSPARAKLESPPPRDVPRAPERRREGTGLIVAGSLSLGASAALAAGAFACAANIRRAEEDFNRAVSTGAPNDSDMSLARDEAAFRGQRAQAGMIATATLSALTGVAGIAMVATGASMRRRARNLAVAPAIAPGFAGAALRLHW